MLSDFLKKNITSKASYVDYGYGQVEPNHLSAQRNGQIYAQLPAAAEIDVLEQGQFVKYDYANEVCNFTGPGEWMLVYNEVKLYRENQMDCEFAMVRDNDFARIYSPVSGDVNFDAQSRFYGAAESQPSWKSMVQSAGGITHGDTHEVMNLDKENVIAPADMYEPTYTNEPFHIASQTTPKKMPKGTKMVPRVFKTMVGDIYTTNMVNFQDNGKAPVKGQLLCVADNGVLTEQSHADSHAGDMRWQVVKIYTLPDHQRAVKLRRVR